MKTWFLICLFAHLTTLLFSQENSKLLFSEDFNNTTDKKLELDGWHHNKQQAFFLDNNSLVLGWKTSVFLSPNIALQRGDYPAGGWDELLISFKYRHEVEGGRKNDLILYARLGDNPSGETWVLPTDIKLVETTHTAITSDWQEVVLRLSREQLFQAHKAFRIVGQVKDNYGKLRNRVDNISVIGLRNDMSLPPSVDFFANHTIVSAFDERTGGEISLYNNSLNINNKTTYRWEITGGEQGTHYRYVNGYNGTMANTKLIFLEQGVYSVRLMVDREGSVGEKLRENYLFIDCPSKSTNTWAGYIKNVTIKQGSTDLLQNESGASNYTDYREDKSTSVNYENSIPIELTMKLEITNTWALHPSNTDDSRKLRYGVWINWANDWNSARFYELAIQTTGGGNTPKSYTVGGTIAIPEGQLPGSYTMRVFMGNGAGRPASACHFFDHGEVEDYRIVIDYEGAMPYLSQMVRWNGATGEADLSMATQFTDKDFTVEGWFYPLDVNVPTPLLGTGDFTLGIENNKIQATLGDHRVAAPWPIFGQWAYVAVVCCADSLSLVVNKAKVSIPLVNHNFEMGNKLLVASPMKGYSSNGRFAMDELRLWNTARTISELDKNRFEIIGSRHPDLVHLTAYYQFNKIRSGDLFYNPVGEPMKILSASPLTIEIAPSEVSYSLTSYDDEADATDPSNWSWGSHEKPSWKNGVVLRKNQHLVVPESDAVRYRLLGIEEGAKVTISENSKIVLDHSLILEDDLQKPISIIGHENIYSGNITLPLRIQVRIPAGRNWYWGRVVDGNYVAGSEAFDHWNYNTDIDSWQTPSEALMPMEGWLVNSPVNQYIYSYGKFKVGDQCIELDYGKWGWNLVSNPYPSYVDLSKAEADLDNNYWDFSHIQPTVWFRTVKDNHYAFATYNVQTKVGVNFPEDTEQAHLVAPGQSFWVRAKTKSNPGSFGVTTKACTHHHDSRSLYNSLEAVARDVLRLELRNSHAGDEVALVFREGNAQTLTSGDSEKRMESSIKLPNLFAIKQNKNLVIANNDVNDERHSIPLGIKLGQEATQNLRLIATNLAYFQLPYEIRLEDTQLQKMINLREQSVYEFETHAFSDNGRFVLHLLKLPTSVPSLPEPADGIHIWVKDGKAIVVLSEELLATKSLVSVYGVDGKLHTQIAIRSNRTEVVLREGVSLVEVVAGDRSKRIKLVK
ncbi:MAG: GEVED domain-containing protein [Breznakibacter sp.]